MLFIPEELIKVKITDDRKVIILTQTKLKISHLDFIEQFSSMNLVGGKPQTFYYSTESSQVLVQTTNTLELYSWRFNSLKLTKVIVLNNEPVYSIYYSSQTGWNIIGDILQYEQPKIVYHSTKEYFTEKISNCFVGRNQYMISGYKLFKTENNQPPQEVEWKDLVMIVKNLGSHIYLTGSACDQMRDFICVNERYLAVVEKYQVIQTIERDRIVYLENSLVISESADSFINFDKLEKRNLVGIGAIPSFPGKIFASQICQADLLALYYKSKQLKIKIIPLVEDKETGKGGRKKLENSISKIIQRSHEGGSILSSPQFEPQQSNMKGSKKPIIRDIEQVEGQNELNRDFFNQESSQVLSRSGFQQQKQREIDFDEIEFVKGNFFEEKKNDDQKENEDQSPSKNIAKLRVKKRHSDAFRTINKEKSSLPENIFQNGNNEDATTPAFGSIGFDNEWDDQKFLRHEVNQITENEYEQEQLKSENEQKTSKAQLFKIKGSKLKEKDLEQIQKKSYIELMEDLSKKNIDRFQEILKSHLWEILNQENSPKFFSQHIRAFSSQSTQDKIRRFFEPYLNKQNSKQKITRALKQFKFNEVPADFIAVPSSVINIILIVCPDLCLKNILQAQKSTLQMLMQAYLMKLPLPQESITIQDEQISLSHPRNMLNILLYINQTLNLPLNVVLESFCKKILKFNYVEVIKKVLQQDIFDICGVEGSILDEIICDRCQELLRQNVNNVEFLWELIELTTPTVRQDQDIKLAVIQEFNLNNITFNLEQLINIKSAYFDIYLFLSELINNNTHESLCQLRFGGLYQSLFWLQEGQKIFFCTNQYLEFVKQLGEKLMEGGYIYHSILNLCTISEKIHKSFIAKLLLLYADGKLINRLVGSGDNYLLLFEDILRSPNILTSDLSHQNFQPPDSSPVFNCSWKQFCNVLQICIPNQPKQLQLLLFMDMNTGQELFLSLSENMKYKFSLFVHEISTFLKEELNDQIPDDDSFNPKAITNIKIINPDEVMESVDNDSSLSDRQAYLLQQPQSNKAKSSARSMNIIDHFNNIKTKDRANSEQNKKQDDILPFDELYHLKILVNKEQILEILKDIYERGDRNKFLKALTMIDLEKVTLYHLEIYKALKDIEYDFQEVIPFEMFTMAQIKLLYQQIEAKLAQKLTINSFWFLCSLIQLIFGSTKAFKVLFIKKIIREYANDKYSQIIGLLLNQIKPLHHADKIELVVTAQKHNLTKTLKQLKRI